MTQLLRANNLEVNKVFDKLIDSLSGNPLPAEFVILETQIARLEFREALETLEALPLSRQAKRKTANDS